MKNQKGFSLVELLVVVIIIAIIAAIAIPNLLASRRAANESSAISTLRTYHSAEATYQATLGNSTNYGATTDLGTNKLVDATLGAAVPVLKSGYSFDLSKADATSTTAATYCSKASPQTPGTTGTGINYFGATVDGVIYKSATSGDIACASGAATFTGAAAPIQ
jgi:prepilin-type N-terminal cleavage/methylation domain-containing protein